MSSYEVNKVCRDLLKDHGFRSAMQTDVQSAIAARDLTAEERRGLIEGDVTSLFVGGASAFLLHYLMRFEVAGLTLPVYNERIRSVSE